MKSSPENLDAFAQRLARLTPAAPTDALNLRLEAALRGASAEMARPRNVIRHPFAHRVAAAAAMVAALIMAVQSTRTQPDAGHRELAGNTQAIQAEPVYEQVNDRLVPVADGSSLQRVKYRGVDVINGRAGKVYRGERGTYFQPFIQSTSKSASPVQKDAVK